VWITDMLCEKSTVKRNRARSAAAPGAQTSDHIVDAVARKPEADKNEAQWRPVIAP
jgi:hypothetical protein